MQYINWQSLANSFMYVTCILNVSFRDLTLLFFDLFVVIYSIQKASIPLSKYL